MRGIEGIVSMVWLMIRMGSSNCSDRMALMMGLGFDCSSPFLQSVVDYACRCTVQVELTINRIKS